MDRLAGTLLFVALATGACRTHPTPNLRHDEAASTSAALLPPPAATAPPAVATASAPAAPRESASAAPVAPSQCEPARRITLVIDEWTTDEKSLGVKDYYPHHRVAVRTASGKIIPFYEDQSALQSEAREEVLVQGELTPLLDAWFAGGGVKVTGRLRGSNLVLVQTGLDEGADGPPPTRTINVPIPPGKGGVCVTPERRRSKTGDAG